MVIPSSCSRVAKSRYAATTLARAGGDAAARRRATTSMSPNEHRARPVASLRSSRAAARSIERSSRLSNCGDTASSDVVIRAVSSAASSRLGSPSTPRPAPTNSDTTIGSPNITTARLRVSTLLSNAIPIGTITTSGAVGIAPSAIRAAPDLTRSRLARSPVVPLGKIATVAPWASSWWQASNTEALLLDRSPSLLR